MRLVSRLQRIEALLSPKTLPLEGDAFGFRSDARAAFIGGCGRSGTTLFRVILGTHSLFYTAPEFSAHTKMMGIQSRLPFFMRGKAHHLYDTEVIGRIARDHDLSREAIRELRDRTQSFPEFFDALWSRAASLHGKSCWAEKTPKNVTIIGYLLKYFQRAKFIHVLRDGRDVACSLRHHPRFRIVDGEKVPTSIVNPIEQCIGRWVADTEAGLRWRGDSRYMEVHYESLIGSPRETVEALCSFLDIRFEQNMLDYYGTAHEGKAESFPQNPEALSPMTKTRIGRWKKDLSYGEAKVIECKAGHLLRKLGYVQGDEWLRHFAEGARGAD